MLVILYYGIMNLTQKLSCLALAFILLISWYVQNILPYSSEQKKNLIHLQNNNRQHEPERATKSP